MLKWFIVIAIVIMTGSVDAGDLTDAIHPGMSKEQVMSALPGIYKVNDVS